MQTMADAGDLAGALAQADRHETERRDELDMPADAEVLAMRDSIAKSARQEAPAILKTVQVDQSSAPETGTRDGNASVVSGSIVNAPLTQARPQSRGSAKLFWIAAAAAVAIAVSVVAQRALSADTGNPAESRIAVMPFAVRGNDRLAYLRNGMVDLLSQRLDGAGAIHTVDPNALLDFIRHDATPESDLTGAEKAASHFGAGKFIVGSIVDAGGRIQISATVYDAGGKRLSVASAFAADETGLLPLVDDLARGLVGGELNDADARLSREAALSTTSLPALKAFLEGEQESRSAHYPAAVELYQKAVRLDSTFALAWYRLSTAADWSSQSDLVSEAIRASVRFESRLSTEEKILLDARMAALRGDDDEVERLYHSILMSHPEDAEAWMQLGETVFHNGGWRGRPIGESRAAFERVAALRVSDASSRLHLARLAALRNDRTALDTLAPAAILLSHDAEQILELKALAALGSGDRMRAKKFVDSLSQVSTSVSATDEAILLATWRVATFTNDPRSAQKLALILTRTENTVATRLSGFLAAAHMAAARGRWNESRNFLQSADQLDHAASLRTRANLLSSGIFPAESGEMRQILAGLEALPPASKNSRASKLIDESIAGRLAAMLNDPATVQRSMRGIQSASRTDSSLKLIAVHLRDQIGAMVKLASGNAADALTASESGWPGQNPLSRYPGLQSEAYTMATGRFLRARLLDESGRVADALPWYETIAEDQGYATWYLAPSYLRRAVAEEKLHRTDAAVGHYMRFIELWRDADPALQPQVRFAQSRLGVLRHGN